VRLRLAAAAILAALFVSDAHARTTKRPAGDVRGCIVSFARRSGEVVALYQPFLKVADKDSPSADGEPEVWGFSLWDLGEPDADGKVKPINVRVVSFIPNGATINLPNGLGGITRCRCPYAGAR
jgi:hypothetical protein